MEYIHKGFNCWADSFVERFAEVYERHDVNMATVFETLAYISIELLMAPLHFINIIICGAAWSIEDRLGKPKKKKESKKKARAL